MQRKHHSRLKLLIIKLLRLFWKEAQLYLDEKRDARHNFCRGAVVSADFGRFGRIFRAKVALRRPFNFFYFSVDKSPSESSLRLIRCIYHLESMKKIQSIVAGALALAVIGAANLWAAENGRVEGKAVARAVHNNVEYQANGSWTPLRPNMELNPGVKLRTGPDSSADLSVNGNTSTVRIQENTTMVIPEMFRVGPVRGADTDTTLDLQLGTVLGNVKKLSASSRYEIRTPHGVAGIRGTDFQVTVVMETGGGYVVTFTSVTGELTVSAVINPGEAPVVKVLRTGESWTPGNGDVLPTPPQVIQAALAEINSFPQGGEGNVNLPTPPHIPVFPSGGPPNGLPSPPATPPTTPTSPTGSPVNTDS
jgi:hypothetical protein